MPDDSRNELHRFLAAQENKDLLRFITCGSVDDGKSTLIGRLLWDSQNLLEDQLAGLEADSRRDGKAGDGAIDYALLLDGLSAEREQGITIDVAYRFFQTDKRKFIVADTPGHEQYTRNMATGASTADLAVILIDARHGVLAQTVRHTAICALMGIRHFILAVNKMDLVGYAQDRFEDIRDDFTNLAGGFGIGEVVCIPVSAVQGDNVVAMSANMGWYRGSTLIDRLNAVDVARDAPPHFRFPVQYVNRPHPDFRGFAGTIVGGEIRPGDEVTLLPSGRMSAVERIVTYDGDRDRAVAGEAVTLTLADAVDASRGELIVRSGEPHPVVADQLQAHLVWMGEEDMVAGRSYVVRLGGATANATVTEVRYRTDVNSHERQQTRVLELNEVGVVTMSLDRPLPIEPYADNRHTGGLVLIDRYSNATVAAGTVDHELRRATNIFWHDSAITREARAAAKNQAAKCLWFTGLSGAGKSTIANELEKALTASGQHAFILDADNVRHGLNKNLGFTEEDRVENIRRMAEVAKLMTDAGLIVMVCAISPYRRDREEARKLFASGDFVEVFVDTPLELCEQRDPKGLYAKARAGEIPNFTGVNAPYEAPEDAEIRLEAGTELAEQVATVLRFIGNNGS